LRLFNGKISVNPFEDHVNNSHQNQEIEKNQEESHGLIFLRFIILRKEPKIGIKQKNSNYQHTKTLDINHLKV